jgi:hypothetical protein
VITINNSNRPNKWLYVAIICLGIILFIALINGCNKSKKDSATIKALVGLTDSLRSISKEAVIGWRESEGKYKDTLEFERGQRELVENKYDRTLKELDDMHTGNSILIKKYKEAKYSDTTTVIARYEFVEDCYDCFTKLAQTDNLSLRLKREGSELRGKYQSELSLRERREKELEDEREAFRTKVDSISAAQKSAVSKIEQRGKLYLSWGVQWQPLPTYAGAGLMYQTKRNMIYGAKWYYGSKGHMVETTINFPLSLRK